MATARARHGSYLFQRPGSDNFWIKLRSPAGRVERSLGTSDRRQAEILALPMIAEHKAALLAARPRLETTWHPQYEPRPQPYPGPNGELITATQRELTFYSADGKFLRTEPNGRLVQRLVNMPKGAALNLDTDQPWPPGPFVFPPGTVAVPGSARRLRRYGPIVELSKLGRPEAPTKNGDDAILETYLTNSNISGYDRREAEATLALFKTLVGKPLKDASRDDGRLLVRHFTDQGLKTATISKKIGWLRSAVNLAIDEDKSGKWTFNPFARIIPQVEDELERHPLSDAELKTCKRNLDKLSASDQLLFRLLAATGMRLGEAFQIDGEAIERRIRYCVVGTKTSQSKRRVPFPNCVLRYLPKKIRGPLFTGDTRAASKRLNRFLDDCGFKDDPSIVVHSLRHRAADRLRASECPPDIRWALLGHETNSVAEDYGTGFPVTKLRKWIDRIGF